MLRTNNPLERLLKEVRRRTKVAEQFPSEESALLLVIRRPPIGVDTWERLC
jgi:transposase-like protein